MVALGPYNSLNLSEYPRQSGRSGPAVVYEQILWVEVVNGSPWQSYVKAVNPLGYGLMTVLPEQGRYASSEDDRALSTGAVSELF